MCENTYSGCPHCQENWEQLAWRTDAVVMVEYPVEEDGEPYLANGTSFVSEDIHPGEEGVLHCESCGEDLEDIAHDLIPDGCDCEECSPSLHDPNALVVFVRTAANVNYAERPFPVSKDTPEEIKALLQQRSVWRILVTRQRAEELEGWISVYQGEWRGYFDHFTTPIKNWMYQSQVPEPTNEEVAA